MRPRLLFLLILVNLLLATSASADFIVRDIQSPEPFRFFGPNFVAIDRLIGGSHEDETTASRQVINMHDADRDTGEGTGFYSDSESFPNDKPGVDDIHFAIHALGLIVFPEAGDYTFGINADDGSRLLFPLEDTVVDLIVDDDVHPPRTFFSTANVGAGGEFLVDFTFFERTGQATVELFAAPGDLDTFDPAVFRLVGDVANGGLQVKVPPEFCGDYDLDGDIDAADQTTLTVNWTGAMELGLGNGSFAGGDCDGDRDIDTADQNSMVQNWTGALAATKQATFASESAIVPEPQGLSLAVVGTWLLLIRLAPKRK